MSGCAVCCHPDVKARGMCNRCYEKWRRRRPQIPARDYHCDGCRHDVALTQLCAVCDRRLCDYCYGDWQGLACESCQITAALRKKEAG